MNPVLRKCCLGGAALLALGFLIALVIGGVFLYQQSSLEPRQKRLEQQVRAVGSTPGRIVLSLSSATVSVKAGGAGEPIRVATAFDPTVHRLDHRYEQDDLGGWTYRLDFHERKLFHVSVFSIWLGTRAPEVTVEIPRDLPLALEARMEGGYLALDLAGLELTTASVELDRGVLGLMVSEPLRVPIDALDIRSRMGRMVLRSPGNASPKRLRVHHGIGPAYVDLDGAWSRDADVDFQVAFGTGKLRLPEGLNVVRLDADSSTPIHPTDEELSPPTIRVSTHFDMGDIRVLD